MAKKARDRKRQTKINFSPAAKSSPTAAMGATPSKNAATTPTKAPTLKNTNPARPSSSKPSRPTAIYSSSEDELAAETHRGMTLGMPVTQTKNGMFGSSDIDAATSDTSEDERRAKNHQVKANLASRKRRRAKDSSEAEDDVGEVTVTKTKRRRQQSPEGEASEDEELSLPRNKRRKTAKSQPPQGEDGGAEDSEEVEVTRAPTRSRRTARRQLSPEEEKSPPRSRHGRASRRQATKEVPEEPSPPRSTRRRLARRPATPSEGEGGSEDEVVDEPENDDMNGTDKDDEEEREDLKADLDFLRSSPLPDRGKLRSAHDKPKNERQKALEALKRRRAGTNEPPSSATPKRSRRVIIESESDSDSELEIIKEEPESDDDDMSDPGDEDEEEEVGSDREANALDMFYEDEDDEGFIDNDPNALIGEPILGPDDFMPLIMSRLSSSKPKELFKYAIEWMVMKKIHPAFDSKSEVYALTFRKLDDEVKGLANSKFSSSAWTSDFTRALRARPDLMIMEISRTKKDIMDAHCEACNRRNHPASDELMFTGQPYNQETLEPLEADSDSDSDNANSDSDSDSESSVDSEVELNGEKPTRDAQGVRLPPESKTFTLGSTCKANAQVAHTLHHWRYHLYSWVKDYLAREGHLTGEKLVQRDGWTNKKREKASLKIVKRMEESGEIRKLYHLYKDQMTYASEVRHDLNRGWKGRG